MDSPGLNEKYLSRDISGTAWVHKVPIDPTPSDSHEREELTFRIGTALGIPIHETIALEDGSTISEYVARGNVRSNPSVIDHLSPEAIGSALAFYNWIGEVDRGTEDALVQNDDVVFIDHGLSGPNSHGFLSSHPYEKSYAEEDLAQLCFPGKQSFFRECVNRGILPSQKLPPIVKELTSFAIHELPPLVGDYQLLGRNGQDFRSDYIKILQARARTIEKDYKKAAKKLSST